MKFEKTSVFNFTGALRGMRNPKESWDKSDSGYVPTDNGYVPTDNDPLNFREVVGENDLMLAQTLIKAGSEHRKFMRQIFVSVDITAPLYWWKEFDTYKVGTVANSTSTMHKLAGTPITKDCFEMDDFEALPCNLENIEAIPYSTEVWSGLLRYLEYLRNTYNETKDKRYWKELIRLLPESWLQKRTVTLNYENLLNMCSRGQRRFHKLTEWSKSFIDWARSLPYAQEFIFLDEDKQQEEK
jgi:hypothetical protein